MPIINIIREIHIQRTGRVIQLEGLFDVPVNEKSRETWTISFDLPENWNVGAVVGPSGSGKTIIINELFRDHIISGYSWSDEKSVVDDFPSDMSIKDICRLLSSVGFSSPPLWLRPFRVLSNGEQFRVTLARGLAENKELSVFDEFTSVVDRTVAQIGSAAVSKTVRRLGQKFIAVTCHYDVLEWLQPDWVLDLQTNKFYNGRYLQRPPIQLEVYRVSRDWWSVFGKYHYLSANIHKGGQFFMAVWNKRPVAFVATLHFPHPRIENCKREHRLVCLPDFQGVGIGNALSEWAGEYWKKLGYRYQSATSHPGIIQYRNISNKWRMIRKPQITMRAGKTSTKSNSWKSSYNRLTASFEYIGN